MRVLRVTFAIALLAALFVQSVAALAAPREARAGGRLPTQYMPQAPQPTLRRDPRRGVYVPVYTSPDGEKDPGSC